MKMKNEGLEEQQKAQQKRELTTFDRFLIFTAIVTGVGYLLATLIQITNNF